MEYTKTKRFKKLAKEYVKNDDKLMDKPKPIIMENRILVVLCIVLVFILAIVLIF